MNGKTQKSKNKRNKNFDLVKVRTFINQMFLSMEKLTLVGFRIRNTKITNRLISSFLLLSIFPLLLTAIVSYYESSSSIKTKITNSSIQLLKQTNRNIAAEMQKFDDNSKELMFNEEMQQILNNYSSLVGLSKFEADKKLLGFITEKFAGNNDVVDARIVTKNKQMIIYGDKGRLSDSQIEELDAKASEKKGSAIWSPMTVDNNYNVICMSRIITSTNTGNKIGNIIITLSGKNFSNIYKDMENTEAFIIDKEGVVVSAGNTADIGKEYKLKGFKESLQKDLNKKKPEQTFSIKNHLVVYYNISNTDWYLAAVISYKYLNSGANGILASISIIVFLCLLLAVIISVLISRSISTPLYKLVSLMDEAKNGNLMTQVDDNGKDEIGFVVRSYNEMIFHIRDLVTKVIGSSGNVLNKADLIMRLSEQSHMSSELVSATIQEISRGATEQALDVNEVVKSISNLSGEINKVGIEMDEVTKIAFSTKQLSGSAMVSVKLLTDKSEETQKVSQNIINGINGLNNQMKEIKKVVDLIVSITEQTKLLALNAAIEAARAGDSGKGFSVVAEEIRKLAAKSREATNSINNFIHDIQKKSENTAQDANSASEIIKNQMEAVQKVDDSFNTIFRAMDGISDKICEIETSVKEVIDSKERSMQLIENISAVSQEAAATTEEVYATTEEQFASAEELANLAKELSCTAKEMDKAVSKFKIGI